MSDDRDFTEDAYAGLLTLARDRYRFLSFDDAAGADGVLWRHDIDISPHRSLALARLEHTAGVRATYFVYLHSRFYNALEDAVLERFHRIAELGHAFGLHFDSRFMPAGTKLDEAVAAERQVLEAALGVRLAALSFHDPDAAGASISVDDTIGGLINAYGRSISARYEYASDSNGYWRFKPLRDVIATAGPRLQVLTHPEWWVPEPMPPRARVARAIDGRAAYMSAKYDAAMREVGRDNLR